MPRIVQTPEGIRVAASVSATQIAPDGCCMFPCQSWNDYADARDFRLTDQEGIDYLRERHEAVMGCTYKQTGECALTLADMHSTKRPESSET